MSGALGALALAYLASRTRHWRIGGAIAAVAPIAACLAVAIRNPEDRVWYAFLALGVLLASSFLSLAATAAVAALSFAGIVVVVAAVPQMQDPSHFVPPLAFHAVFSPLMLLAAHHRDRLEAERRRSLLAGQASLAESQRLETVGRLAGGIAHDFNNLLTVIFANVASLRRGGAGPELDEISEAAEQSAALVRQLLAFSRRQVLVPSLLSPGEVIAGMDRILRHLAGPHVSLEVERHASVGLVRVDAGQLEQVLLNLVLNARDAIPEGGTVRLRLRDVGVEAGSPEAREGVPPGDHVALEVADDGAGMTEEVRRRAFEPFFTTKEPGRGTGIGLSTVHGIVSQSGGRVLIRSAPGQGSTFTVYLPRVPAPAAPPAAAPPAAAREGRAAPGGPGPEGGGGSLI
jgi:signal transduction histidine kinase